MDALIKYQEDLHTRMVKAQTNFSKSPKERITRQYVEGRLELLDQMWLKFSSGHEKLMCSFSDEIIDSQYSKDDIYESTEEVYFEYKVTLKTVLAKFNIDKPTPVASTSSNCSSKSCDVKLPKVNIPKFSGKYSEWNTFRDLFTSLIKNNKNLENVQKLLYLKGYLCGEAEQLLNNIPISDDNFQRCWKLLEDRYNNKKYICHHILKRLFSQRNILNESANSLKELLDTTNDCLAALKNLGIDITSWDVLIIHILTLKLDVESRRQWEFHATDTRSNVSDELPTYKQFCDFLTNRYRAMEFLDPRFNFNNRNQNLPVNKTKSMHVSNTNCPFCSEEHKLSFCQKFKNESVDSRREFVQSNNICFCCLGSKHSARFCQANVKCRICRKKHHALLHPAGKGTSGIQSTVAQVKDTPLNNSGSTDVEGTDLADPVISLFSTKDYKVSQVLLATALLDTTSRRGEKFVIRALLDQGSQSSFITESIVQLLSLKKIPVRSQISGVGGENSLISKAMVEIEVSSRTDPNVRYQIRAYVLPSITTLLPSEKVKVTEWKEFTELVLADPGYSSPSRIDMLLGAEIYSQILQDGVKKSPVGSLVAQATSLGWILSGAVQISENLPGKIKVMHCQVNDNELLKRFWELEDEIQMSKEKMYTEEERRCEEIFAETTRRDEEGRYIVRLPVTSETPEVTNSLQIAQRRLYSLERRLKDGDLKEQYKAVINEYVTMGHMELVPENEIKRRGAIYLPHHAVVREDRETTKVRTVFDASCKGTNKMSLNDNMLIGPTLQPDLRHVVLRWRMPPICLVADIVKMYRQVKVDKADADYLRILWRDDTSQNVKHYRMLRVTFGVASSPYLAVKALQQVAIDEGQMYPMAAEKVATDFYMDDLMTGCETKEDGIKLYREMNELLAKGGFELQKWTSNSQELLKEMKEFEIKGNEDEKEIKESLKIKTDEIIKIVGLTWNRSDDSFTYKVVMPALKEPATKRSIIADISRFYDPLGWVGPSIIISKMLIQKLWLAGIDWDEAVPTEILNEWSTYREELKLLSNITIPRWIGIHTGDIIELHGFSDASKDAYAAVIYCRVIDSNGGVRVALIMAKTRVAPVRQISIPRLELCGAVLLTRLMIEVATVMNIDRSRLHAWTDSTIVLAWLNGHPNRWKVFVANRVSEILSSLDTHHWSHVSSKDNPADVASRGLFPADLIKDSMWFQGPEFLHKKQIEYLKPKDMNTELERIKIKSHGTVTQGSEVIWERFSSLTRMIRVVAYCKQVSEALATNGCNFHFIPSRAPNFGGLWEAGVKSVKYHLSRVIGQSTLTFEELSTVLAQVEACLNSRPLSVITCNDDENITVLTPGHFLVGEPLVVPPDRNFENSNLSSLRRWQYTQRMLQDFWRQWSKQYLNKFYQRYRWSTQNPQPKVGDIVLVKEDNSPACRWLYGRVIATHPGQDNIVRVVTLKVKNGTIKRSISKLCPLPIET
ncbi:hypothetical protein ABMA27_012663 [Loxostege sticticalis]|uniref:Peptidase A2 domain-containing protein n=1 Tax=Loxostege sticticalis TaxID=481309 RepID=A0ABR3GZF4_LOXSC